MFQLYLENMHNIIPMVSISAWKFALMEAFNIQSHHQRIGAENYQQYTMYLPPGSTLVVTERGPTIHQPDGWMMF